MKLLIFLLLTIGIAAFSWPYLRNPRAHGFFRFFAFETIVLLVLTNSKFWFQDPFAIQQIISWLLLISSLLLVIHGICLLMKFGEPGIGLEDTTQLVTSGAYRYIRHPMYCSLLLFGAGVLLKHVSLTSVSLYIALIAFLIATGRIEESENSMHFGKQYTDYVKMTKMFVPYIF